MLTTYLVFILIKDVLLRSEVPLCSSLQYSQVIIRNHGIKRGSLKFPLKIAQHFLYKFEDKTGNVLPLIKCC